MKVLLVDDEEAILDVFKQALESAQFEVITALTGSQGMDLTKKEHPDVIFLDQVLPDMNGNQVLEQLKADPETKMIPIAILSNFNQDSLVANAMKMGAADYILKYQIAPQDLATKATGLLQEAHILPPNPQIAQPTTPTPAPVAPAAAPIETVQPAASPEEPKPTQ